MRVIFRLSCNKMRVTFVQLAGKALCRQHCNTMEVFRRYAPQVKILDLYFLR